MRYLFQFILFFSVVFAGRAQVLPQYPIVPLLDSTSRVYLMTCDPGPEIWSVFGHAGIRIQDTVNGIDWVYNYGTFAFSDDFLWKFVQGDLNYRISREKYSMFLEEYESYPRGVLAQELNMDLVEKQKLIRLLETNYLPENRYYQYDFLFDNCSTRLRDAIDSATSGKVKYDYSFIKQPKSYRGLIRGHADHMKWLMLAMDYLIGSRTDILAQNRDYFFLPDYLMEGYYFAEIEHSHSLEKFVSKSFVVVDAPRFRRSLTWYQSPWFVLGCITLFVLLISFIEILSKRWFKWIDIFVLFFIGNLGLVVFLISILTRHHTTYENLNLLWCNPIYLVLIPMCFIVNDKWRYYLFTFFMIWMIVLLVCFPIFPQSFNIGFIPLMMLIVIRFFTIRNHAKQKYLHAKAFTKNS